MMGLLLSFYSALKSLRTHSLWLNQTDLDKIYVLTAIPILLQLCPGKEISIILAINSLDSPTDSKVKAEYESKQHSALLLFTTCIDKRTGKNFDFTNFFQKGLLEKGVC